MRADQPVGGGAAHKISAGDQPEVALAGAVAERLKGGLERVCRRRLGSGPAVVAVGGEAEVARPVAHQEP